MTFGLNFGPIRGQKGLKNIAPGPKFYTLQMVVPVSFKNWFHMNPVETFCKIEEKVTLNLFWPYSGWKGTQNMAPLGTNVIHTTQSSSSELKKQVSFESSRNLLQNRQKTSFGPSGAIFHTKLEVPTICL